MKHPLIHTAISFVLLGFSFNAYAENTSSAYKMTPELLDSIAAAAVETLSPPAPKKPEPSKQEAKTTVSTTTTIKTTSTKTVVEKNKPITKITAKKNSPDEVKKPHRPPNNTKKTTEPKSPALSVKKPIATVSKKATPKSKPIEKKLKVTAAHFTMIMVQKGDTLRGIARRIYGDEKRYREIYQLNPKIIKDPNIVPYGRIIKVKK